VLAVDRVPRRLLESRVDRVPAGDEIGIDLLHRSTRDEPVARVTRCRYEVELRPLLHQSDHLVGRAGGLHVHFAVGVGFELGNPVVVLVGLTAFDVTGPGDDVHLPFALADLGECARSFCVTSVISSAAIIVSTCRTEKCQTCEDGYKPSHAPPFLRARGPVKSSIHRSNDCVPETNSAVRGDL
jgi:hypothetical protein